MKPFLNELNSPKGQIERFLPFMLWLQMANNSDKRAEDRIPIISNLGYFQDISHIKLDPSMDGPNHSLQCPYVENNKHQGSIFPLCNAYQHIDWSKFKSMSNLDQC